MCVYVKQLDGMNNKVKRNYHQPRFGRLYLASENAEPLSVLLTCFSSPIPLSNILSYKYVKWCQAVKNWCCLICLNCDDMATGITQQIAQETQATAGAWVWVCLELFPALSPCFPVYSASRWKKMDKKAQINLFLSFFFLSKLAPLKQCQGKVNLEVCYGRHTIPLMVMLQPAIKANKVHAGRCC